MRNHWIIKNQTKCFVEKIKQLIDFKVSKRSKVSCNDDFSWDLIKSFEIGDRIKKENESLYVKIIEVDRFGIEAAYLKNKHLLK